MAVSSVGARDPDRALRFQLRSLRLAEGGWTAAPGPPPEEPQAPLRSLSAGAQRWAQVDCGSSHRTENRGGWGSTSPIWVDSSSRSEGDGGIPCQQAPVEQPGVLISLSRSWANGPIPGRWTPSAGGNITYGPPVYGRGPSPPTSTRCGGWSPTWALPHLTAHAGRTRRGGPPRGPALSLWGGRAMLFRPPSACGLPPSGVPPISRPGPARSAFPPGEGRSGRGRSNPRPSRPE